MLTGCRDASAYTLYIYKNDSHYDIDLYDSYIGKFGTLVLSIPAGTADSIEYYYLTTPSEADALIEPLAEQLHAITVSIADKAMTVTYDRTGSDKNNPFFRSNYEATDNSKTFLYRFTDERIREMTAGIEPTYSAKYIYKNEYWRHVTMTLSSPSNPIHDYFATYTIPPRDSIVLLYSDSGIGYIPEPFWDWSDHMATLEDVTLDISTDSPIYGTMTQHYDTPEGTLFDCNAYTVREQPSEFSAIYEITFNEEWFEEHASEKQ